MSLTKEQPHPEIHLRRGLRHQMGVRLDISRTVRRLPLQLLPGRRSPAQDHHRSQSQDHQRRAIFRFASDQSGARFQCKLTGWRVATALRHWRPCTSPERYRLRPGGKVFSVRAVKGGSPALRRPGAGPRQACRSQASCSSHHAPQGDLPCFLWLRFRCHARVTAKAGRKVLARGRCSVPAHGSRRVAIRLTTAGRMALARKRRVRAKLTIVDTRTHKRETLPVVLRRR